MKKDRLKKQDKYIQKLYDLASINYEFQIKAWFFAMRLSEKELRQDIINFFTPNKSKVNVLEVSIGTGSNIPFIKEKFPNAKIDGIDISMGMLSKCKKKNSHLESEVNIIHGNGSFLPYPDNSFDYLLHVGGINSFHYRKKALAEMLRVIKPGGKVVINDEGFSPELRDKFWPKLVFNIFVSPVASIEKGEIDPPMSDIPSEAKNINLEYVGKGYFWVLTFEK
ncbi:class I SAM-dependent methyltransferase [Aliikangiella sp. IMCC44359]|uniref:class I SAM-dependent methyltransferase n=1 Tax=Aliikangiella sp. IMCC44359 TaxID=3459125 RepID=UPI00403AD166